METIGPVRALRTLVAGPDRRVSAGHGWFYRYGVPLGLLALALLGWANYAYLADTRHLHVLAMLLSIGSVVPVAIAVRRPLLAFRIAYPMLFLGTVYSAGAQDWPWSPVQILGFLFVMVTVAVVEASAVTFWAAGLTAVVPYLYAPAANATGIVVLLIAIALFGDILNRRRSGRLALAEQTELTELERARRSILEERTRIAREMHDVVAHHMSMIAVQAETAPFRLPGMDEPMREELAGIATSARSALTDMRRLLGVLRSDDADALRAPQPGLADVPALAETARRAGVEVTLPSDNLPAVREPVGLAAYRIVQEALANAARHAPGAPVAVEAGVRGSDLLVSVTNGAPTATATPRPGAGLGQVGMRERAELLGGTLTAGPIDDGGYRVIAVLPLEEAG